MYRMYGQIFAPAISALPPSVVVVCRGAMDGKERRMPTDGRYSIKSQGRRCAYTHGVRYDASLRGDDVACHLDQRERSCTLTV